MDGVIIDEFPIQYNMKWLFYSNIYIYYYMKLCYIIFNYIKLYIYIYIYNFVLLYYMCVIHTYIYIMHVHSTTTHHAKLYWQHLVIKVWDSHCSHGRVSKSSRGWWDVLSIWMTIGRDLLMTIPWWEWLLGISFVYLSGFDVEQNYNIIIYIYIRANYNNSLTWIKAIWGWFPILTMIPVRSQWGRYNLPRYIYSIYAYTSVDLSGFDIGSKFCVDVEQVLLAKQS